MKTPKDPDVNNKNSCEFTQSLFEIYYSSLKTIIQDMEDIANKKTKDPKRCIENAHGLLENIGRMANIKGFTEDFNRIASIYGDNENKISDY